jgi:hypothetical protein
MMKEFAETFSAIGSIAVAIAVIWVVWYFGDEIRQLVLRGSELQLKCMERSSRLAQPPHNAVTHKSPHSPLCQKRNLSQLITFS